MTPKTVIRIAILMTTLTVASIGPVHANPVDDAAITICQTQISATQDAFNAFPDGVPAPLAASGFQAVYAACYRPDPLATAAVVGNVDSPNAPPVLSGHILDNVRLSGLGSTCSGGGTTLLGWAEFLWVGGRRFHITNSPASSYVAWYADPYNSGKYLREGSARSVLDNMEFFIANRDAPDARPTQLQYWDFASIPMGGDMWVYSHCETILVMSSTIVGRGYPFGFDISQVITGQGPRALMVEATGTTCIIPC
ncbi:MAG: hypothetical protein QOG31_1808 [Thermoplasmata archaeon]|jgi:hypothetical protein|nr:hypothetical protein [Thermoplasmata archaeon]